MADLDEGDSCRICRSGAEPDQPLYHPCKCTGSIRYCHQDCLLEWLQHSRKKYCELCNHSFIFHKRYRKDMPTDGCLPRHLYLRRSLRRSAELLGIVARAILVAITWLAVLPYININIWRLCFWLGSGTAAFVVFELAPVLGVPAPDWAPVPRKEAALSLNLARIFRKAELKRLGKRLAHDCFEGQILTCVIVVLFVAVFLLREWILQNAPQQLDVLAGAHAAEEPPEHAEGARDGDIPAAPAAAQERRAPPPAALAARDNAAAQMQAQTRQAAQSLSLQELQDSLEARQADREALRRTLEERLDKIKSEIARREAVNGAEHAEGDEADAGPNGDDMPMSTEELRRVRLRKFDHAMWQTRTAPDHPPSSSSTSALMPPEPSSSGQAMAGPGFRFDFDLDEEGTEAAPVAGPPGPESQGTKTAPDSADAASGTWPSWSAASTENSTPKRNSVLMADGSNAVSLSVPSWQEGSASSPITYEDEEEEKDRKLWSSPISVDKGKGKAHDENDEEPGTAGRETTAALATSESVVESSTGSHGDGRSVLPAEQSERMPALLDPAIARVDPPAARSSTESEHEAPLPNGRNPEETNEASEESAVAASDQGHNAPELSTSADTSIRRDERGAQIIEPNDADRAATGHDGANGVVATMAAQVPNRAAVAAAAANGDPVAEALLEVADQADDRDGDAAQDDANMDDDFAEDFEDDVNFLEEIDGLLFAIGMRGPLFGLLQNLLLMIVLCGFAIMLFVSMPYVVGKILGPGIRLLAYATLPIKALRLITDPVFDAVIWFGSHQIWPALQRLQGSDGISSAGSSAAAVAEGAKESSILGRVASGLAQGFEAARSVSPQHASSAASASSSSSGFWNLTEGIRSRLDFSQSQSAVDVIVERMRGDATVALSAGILGPLLSLRHVVTETIHAVDVQTLGPHSSSERVLCIVLGLAYWLLALGAHRQLTYRMPPRSNIDGSSYRLVMDQQLLIVKVLGFLFVELAIFPLGCGLLLDLCMMPIFEGASIFNWYDRYKAAPFTFGFTRWMAGTIYMFLFAQYVHITRGILRPGVLCWIRDPNDPGFHPIKDILSKPSLTQLRKIGASAVMYAGILVASVGVNVYFLRYALGATGVLPLRWKPMDPLSEVPFDLLVVHLVVPWLGEKFDAEKAFSDTLRLWWTSASRMLRLSTYMIGGDFLEERGGHGASPRTSQLLGNGSNSPKPAAEATDAANGGANASSKVGDHVSGGGSEHPSPPDASVEPEGGYCRVPGDDKSVTSGPLIIPVREDGSALTERGADAIFKQDEAAATKTPKPTYVTMWMPPHYRFRIGMLLALLWISHSVASMAILAVPTLLGRRVAVLLSDRLGSHRMQREPHDFYAYCLGASMLFGAVWTVRASQRLYRRAEIRMRSGNMPRALPPRVWAGIFVAVSMIRRTVRLGRAAVLGFGLGVVVPLLVGLVIDQYLITPLRDARDAVPEVNLWQTWALGVVESKLLLKLLSLLPENTVLSPFHTLPSSLDAVYARGFRHPLVLQGYRHIILPLSTACVCLLVLPAYAASIILSLDAPSSIDDGERKREQRALRTSYNLVLVTLISLVVIGAARRRMQSWTEILKDEVFLESTELKNYEVEGRLHGGGDEGGGEGEGEGEMTREGRWQGGNGDAAGEDKSNLPHPQSTAANEGGVTHQTGGGGDTAGATRSDPAYEAEGPLPDVLLR